MFGNPQNLLLPFVKKEQIAKSTWSFYFARDNYPGFFPGQYNIVTIIPDLNKNTPNLSHEFTICSSPSEMNNIMITTKIEKKRSKFKEILFRLKPDAEVQFEGPKGGFYLRAEDKTSRVFISGGIGITPFHSMINFAHEKKLKIPMILFANFSTPEEVIFYEELKNIQNNNAYIKVVYIVSHSGKVAQATASRIDPMIENDNFGKGRISEEIIKKYIKDVTKPIFMIAGPPAMVEDVTILLDHIKVPSEKIKVDLFTGY